MEYKHVKFHPWVGQRTLDEGDRACEDKEEGCGVTLAARV
jgi:hypothetical protein